MLIRIPSIPRFVQWLGLWAAILLVCGWFAVESKSFQTCINQPNQTNQTKPNEASENGSPILAVSVGYQGCLGKFVSDDHDAIIAVATVLLTFVTSGLVVVGFMQMNTSRAQLRAYISVVAGNLLVPDGNEIVRFEFQPGILNTGQTPAHNVRTRGIAEIRNFPLPPNSIFELPNKSPNASNVLLGPQQSTFVALSIKDPILNAVEIAALKENRHRRLVVYGIVEYDDVFGRPHYTRFCQTVAWATNGQSFANWDAQHNDAN